MQPEELAAFCETVQKDIGGYEQSHGEQIVHRFPKEVLDAVSKTGMRTVPPFAVMQPIKMGPSVGATGPVGQHAGYVHTHTRMWRVSRHVGQMCVSCGAVDVF
jgi:hypothetical protein